MSIIPFEVNPVRDNPLKADDGCRRLPISNGVELIKLLIKHIGYGGKNEVRNLLGSSSIDWEKFKKQIIHHEIASFSYLALRDLDSFLPEDLREFLKNNYYCALARCQNLWQQFLQIFDSFEQAGVTLLPLKGIALLYDIYPKNPFRPMTDIDLLVKEENLPKAEQIFYGLGYRKELYGLKEEYWRQGQCHIVFYPPKDEEKLPFVELHWSLDFKRKNRCVLPELWARIRGLNADGRIIKLLSPEDTLFSLALHSRRFGKTLCLKSVYDALFLLNKYGVDFDWEYCLRMSRKYRMQATLFFILCQIRFLAGLEPPGYVWEGLKFSRRKKKAIQRFIEKNTFLTDKNSQGRNLYLRSHFLLYDSFWQPIDYILNIPKEQFAKYYGLAAYSKKTDFFYKNRLFYIPFKAIFKALPR
ncbi:MAG: nucleotidyltransferase family protein [Candidatus Omnitrophica bacterium]|nr:nucleotidyltransferase family protein [Candidatus Omnitrophota bacterium]